MTTYTSEIQIANRARYARGWVSGSTSSSSNTSVTIGWSIGCQQKSAALYGQEAYCYVDGNYAGYVSGYISSSSSSWKDVCSKSGTYSIAKGTSSKTVTVQIKTRVCPIDDIGSYTSSYYYASETVTIPALASYTVSYDANGGSGAPSSQTKWYGQTLTLSSTAPTKSGYKFIGWATSSTATTAAYAAGGSYTSNSAVTLYAVWSANATCTIKFNANGGSNAPASITHLIDTVSTIPTSKPTKDGYYFLGWATSSTATKPSYYAGGTYTNNNFTNGTTVTLYAVWKVDRQVLFRLPDGVLAEQVSQIYVRVPEGASLDSVWVKIELTSLLTSDGLYLVDSNGNYLTVLE